MRYSALSNLGINICRLGVAVTFILSGFVKAVDPIGSQIKIEDYLSAWHVSQYIPDILTSTGDIGVISPLRVLKQLRTSFVLRY